MLCAWQHVKIGLGNDYDDHYKPKSEKTGRELEDRNFENNQEDAKILLIQLLMIMDSFQIH